MPRPSDASLPFQLHGELFFPEPAGLDPGDYLRLVAQAQGHTRPDDATVAAALDGHVGPAADLPLLDAEASLASRPKAVGHVLRAAQSELVGRLRPVLPVPSGETLVSLEATCLRETRGRYSRGTVVVVQRTSTTRRLLLLPLVRVDVRSGRPAVKLPHLEVPYRDQAHAHTVTSMVHLAGGAALLDSVLRLGGVLSFALPPPWGALASGSFTLFQLILGSDKADPFAEVIQTLERFLDERAVEQWSRTVRDFLGGPNGLNTQLDALQKTVSNDQTVYINDTLLPLINRAADPGTSDNVNAAASALHDYVQELVSGAKDEARDAYYAKKPLPLEDTLDLALAATSAFLVALKIKVQLYATLASVAKNAEDADGFTKNTGAWLDSYAVFALATNGDGDDMPGYVKTMNALVDSAQQVRTALVGTPYYVSATVIGHMGAASKGYGWGFTDAAVEDPRIEAGAINASPTLPQHFVADTPPSGCCGSNVEHKDELVAMRKAYVADVTGRFDKRRRVVKGWADSIQEWNSNLPPQPPTGTPSVHSDARWTAGLPQPPDWVTGNAVAYAVSFANASGPSQHGGFCEWIEITDYAFPTVTIPTDPLGMADARWLYRRFRTSTTPRIIAVIPDNTTTTYVDTRP